jgi:hypothetical protein
LNPFISNQTPTLLDFLTFVSNLYSMKKTKIWKSDNVAKEIEEYINGRADLKSRPPLTIELLKTFPGCENYTDEEAAFHLKCFDTLCPILMDLKLPLDKKP